MVENNENEQEMEGNCWYDEEICSDHVLGGVLEKGPPGLRRLLPVANRKSGILLCGDMPRVLFLLL